MHPQLSADVDDARRRHLLRESEHAREAAHARAAHRRAHGDLVLRPLTDADAHHVRALFDRLSAHSRHLRFLGWSPRLTPERLARLSAVDRSHEAVGAFDGGDLVGAAHYFRSSEAPDRAEVALEVADSHQARGLGHLLLRDLALMASRKGITHVTATVLAENRAVLRLLHRSGWDADTTIQGSEIDLVVRLPSDVDGLADVEHEAGHR